MSEQTRACEGFNNKSGDKHQLANLLVSAASLSMLHLYRSACKAIPWPLSDPHPPFFLFFLSFFPSRILQIFRGSSLLICSTDSKRGGSRRAAPSVWGQSILGKELQRPPALLCTVVPYRNRQKRFYSCSAKDISLIKWRGLLPFYIIPPVSLLQMKSCRHGRARTWTTKCNGSLWLMWKG